MLRWNISLYFSGPMMNLLILPKPKLKIKQMGRTKFYEHMDVLMGHRKPKFTNKQTTILHYIQRQGVDIKTSLYLNPLYDLTQNPHKFSCNKYW